MFKTQFPCFIVKLINKKRKRKGILTGFFVTDGHWKEVERDH